MLIKTLEDDLRKQLAPRRSHLSEALAFGEAELERIRGVHGRMTRTTAAKQREGGRRVGTSVSKHCCICEKYLKIDGSVRHVQTCFYCSVCKMPL